MRARAHKEHARGNGVEIHSTPTFDTLEADDRLAGSSPITITNITQRQTVPQREESEEKSIECISVRVSLRTTPFEGRVGVKPKTTSHTHTERVSM